MEVPRVIVVMGISGSGKSTTGRNLATRLRWQFHDGDDFHPLQNVAKMSRGTPLDDGDRLPWLAAMHQQLASVLARGESAVLAASLLKQEYRDRVLSGLAGVRLVYLKADPLLIQARLQQRQGHFFQSGLLRSQLEILEEPADALVVDVESESATLVSRIVHGLGLDTRSPLNVGFAE